MKNNYLKQAWLVLILAAVFGGGLAGVESSLKPRILQNRLKETIDQIPALVPGAAGGQQETVGAQLVYRATTVAGQTAGWVVPANGQGFADRIEILLGLDAVGEKITGVYVLDQKETPGLGNKIVEPVWRDQFTDKPAATRFVVTKMPPTTVQQIHGVTGATISSESVVDIVNRTARTFRAALADDDGA